MHVVHELMIKLVEVIGHWGYGGIFILMMLESTFVPVPSELVMPPAGYLASPAIATTDPHHMNLVAAILVGTLGCMAGASINYGIAYFLGRPFFLKYGKYVLCPPHKFEKMEKFFITHGEFGTFTGRLILGVRHFISFPAGLARMHYGRFLFYTALGSAIWCAILAVIGWYIGKVSAGMTPEQLSAMYTKYGKQAGIYAAIGCIVLIVGYVWWQRRKKADDSPIQPLR